MWLRDELATLDPSPADLRKFALVFGGALAALGAFAWYRGSGAAPYLALPGLAAALVGLLAPTLLRALYFGWMAIGLLLGTVVTSVILTVVFVIAVTPVAVVMRLAGKDPLNRRIEPEAESYWIPRSDADRERGRLRKYF